MHLTLILTADEEPESQVGNSCLPGDAAQQRRTFSGSSLYAQSSTVKNPCQRNNSTLSAAEQTQLPPRTPDEEAPRA